MTTPRARRHIPWYERLDLVHIVPAGILAVVMLWSVVQSIAIAGWAEGLGILVQVALPGLLAGIIFARVAWLPGWLAHTLSALLGVAWAVQRAGPLLVEVVARELNRAQADRLLNWTDYAAEMLIRAISWGRTLGAGGRGEDIVLFIVALALLAWALGYTTAWLLFRKQWVWLAIVINAVTILVNYTFAFPKPNGLFFIFLGAALLLVVHQQIVYRQQAWHAALIEYPSFLTARAMVAASLFALAAIVITSILPGNVTSVQAARAWRTMSAPFTAMRESWETAFSTINAPPGASGGGFVTRSLRVGGGRSLGDSVVMLVRSKAFDYWRTTTFDRYQGQGWDNTVGERARVVLGTSTVEEARTEIDANSPLPTLGISARELVTQTVTIVSERNDALLSYGGQFVSSNLPTLVQHGYIDNNGAQLPNFEETSAVFSQVPLQNTTSYTVTSLMSEADVQSLQAAQTTYPDWIASVYLQLPETVTERTIAEAQRIVDEAGATTPYDKAIAIQNYLRSLTYDETRRAPPANRDWSDYFLFDTKVGYCDDFATAMIVLLRSQGIPARFAQGYAGGTYVAEQAAYEVRESIAHSWPEVYFPGYGWQRFEPTPASYANPPQRPSTPVTPGSSAPSESSLNFPSTINPDLLDEYENRLNDTELNAASIAAAAAEREAALRQQQVLNWLGGLVFVALIIGVAAWLLHREVAGLPPAQAAYARMLRMAHWIGLPTDTHQTPHEYAATLRAALPGQASAINAITDAFVAQRYHGSSPATAEALATAWKELRPAMLRLPFERLAASARRQPS